MTKKLKLLDGDKRSLGTYAGVNPDATSQDIALFIEGVNGLRNTAIRYAHLITEEAVYEAGAGE